MIELCVTVAVAAIIVALAAPAVNGYLDRQAPQHAADELYGDIQLARLRAARNNQRCRIVFNLAANQYTLIDFDNNGALIGPFKTVDLNRHRGGVTLAGSPSPADAPPFNRFEFLSTGVQDQAQTLPVTSNSMFITNPNNDIFFQVTVSLAGGTTVNRWDFIANTWR